jgi:hypothetical protein
VSKIAGCAVEGEDAQPLPSAQSTWISKRRHRLLSVCWPDKPRKYEKTARQLKFDFHANALPFWAASCFIEDQELSWAIFPLHPGGLDADWP